MAFTLSQQVSIHFLNFYYLIITKELQEALENRWPVVALESTIISHGLPYPLNIEVAQRAEQIIRNSGAIPATIAVINGDIKIGLTEDYFEMLGRAVDVEKVSTRDLPYVISKKLSGGTTVSATTSIASRAGIKIFATGGIGGVHRFVSESWDISSDLQTLSECNVAVVSAGAKAILDLPKTLELFETLNIPVIGYRTNEFPAFYSSRSGLKLHQRCDTPKEIAQLLHTKWDLGLRGGVLIANPVAPEYEIDAVETEKLIEKALKLATEKNISGKEVTPFLLKYLNENSGGNLPETNRQLLWNNAKLAADLAVAYFQE